MSDPTSKSITALVRLLHFLRNREHLSLEDLAERAGIHRTHLGLLERGERQPTLAVAQQLAKALGYDLSELLLKAELVEKGRIAEDAVFKETFAREERPACLRNEAALVEHTGLTGASLLRAIHSCYSTLDTIDAELTANAVQPVARLVELANFSSMMGNLLGAAVAESSEGLYRRNKPHAYPDLVPLTPRARNLEVKMALETNSPKGHLPKAGLYLTFRYVLGTATGMYTRGTLARGDTAWVWEVKVGALREADFSISNTDGDSGKTAVIKTQAFNAMPLVYFDPAFCPYAFRKQCYPGIN